MLYGSRSRWAAAAVLVALTGACATAEPVAISSQFSAPGGASWAYRARSNAPAPCRIALGEVRDTRADVTSMGEIAGRAVRAENAAAWIRSAFESLDQDTRLRLVASDDAAGARLVLGVDLIKAYISSVTTDKAANVVVRVRYSQGGAPAGEQLFRGDDNGMNWASGDEEAQDTLNNALKEVIAAVDKDVLARCQAAPPAPSS